jgi:hypothetical protein
MHPSSSSRPSSPAPVGPPLTPVTPAPPGSPGLAVLGQDSHSLDSVVVDIFATAHEEDEKTQGNNGTP